MKYVRIKFERTLLREKIKNTMIKKDDITLNEKELKSHISFLIVLFICIAVFLIGIRFSAESSNKEKTDFVGGTVATWEYIERDIPLDYFYHLDSKATYEQIRKEIGEPSRYIILLI